MKVLRLGWKPPRYGDAEPYLEFVVAKRSDGQILVGTRAHHGILKAYPVTRSEAVDLAEMLLDASDDS